MKTQNASSVPHAYSPTCHCPRCYCISMGWSPAEVDEVFPSLVPTPVPVDNVIVVDFKARKRKES